MQRGKFHDRARRRAQALFAGLILIISTPAYAAAEDAAAVALSPDGFASLYAKWTSGDQPASAPESGAVPSERPLESFRYTSPFGARVDPFRGGASFHPGVDLSAPIGTPVRATADATVIWAAPYSGYGNLVRLDHGAGLETRYGHLSRILVASGQHVHRGDLIGLVGSTGRSTGSHLHYEIRLSGLAVNPLPYMAPGDERLALNQAVGPNAGKATAMGGPALPIRHARQVIRERAEREPMTIRRLTATDP